MYVYTLIQQCLKKYVPLIVFVLEWYNYIFYFSTMNLDFLDSKENPLHKDLWE
jgi:hypothetical protein